MLQIIIKETKDFLRDKSNVFFFLIFPVLLVFLLGNLLSGLDKAEDTIGVVKIHYMLESEENMDIMAIDGFIEGVSDEQNILFVKTEDLKASKEMVGEGDIAAAIVFTNSPMEIHIYEGMDRIKNRTISAMMSGFSQINRAVKAIVKSNPMAIMDSMNSVDSDASFIRQKDLGINRTMLDYYAITMMSMISFMSIILGTMCFLGERQFKTMRRLKIAPINQVKLFLAKVLGLIPQVILQITILMIVSVFVFGASYSPIMLDNIYLFFMFLAVTFTVILIGAVIGLYAKANPTVITFPLVWIMMFLSGTYSKEIFIDGVSQYLPIYQIQKAAFDLAIFGRYNKANIVIIVCLILSLIMLVIGAIGFSRREEQ